MSLPRRHLSAFAQVILVAGLVIVVGAAIFVWPVIGKNTADQSGRAQPAPSVAAPGSFKPTREQWAGFDPNTHRLSVRADVENSDGALKPGMFANFSIITGKAATAPAVPQRAIVYEGDTPRVWVAGEGGSIAARSVRTGQIADGTVEIPAGQSQSEKFVISGALFIDHAAAND